MFLNSNMRKLYLVALVLNISATARAEKTPLYVGALFELSNHWYQKYVNFFIDIIEDVFEEVENRTDILEEYSLQLITKDTQGKGGLAAKRLFQLMTEGPPIVAVLGPTLSYSLAVVGQITPFYDVLQLSYIALATSTLSTDSFPTLFKVNQMMDDLNPLRIKMMQYFNWYKVGTIFFQNGIFVSHMNNFHDLLKQYNMTLLTSAVGALKDPNINVLVSRLVHYDVRIIMGTFSNTNAPQLFCEAYKQGLYGSNYVWILAASVISLNYKDLGDITQYGCTYDQISKVIDGIFTLHYDQIAEQNDVTIANLTPADITNTIETKISKTDYKLSSYYGWVYDAAWTLAVGLNNSLRHLNDSGLHGYTNNLYYLDAIMKGMYEVNFRGISGPVSFDEHRGRAGLTYMEQNINNTRVRVAMYNHKTDDLVWFVDPKSLWPGDEVPKDSFTYTSVRVAPNIPSLVLITVTNSICLVIAFGFLAFNIYYRNNSNIKLSSPMINNIIIGGSICMLFSVYITTFDYGHLLSGPFSDSICMVRIWIMCVGFTCLFGALFSKTWRVHILFRDHKLKRKTIKDRHLFGVICILLLIDCVILMAWTFTHDLHKASFVKKKKDLHNQNNIIAEKYTFCHQDNEGYWFVSIYIYKGLLLAFGTFLAWETRHVVVPALNDSKYIGFCIYNVVIVCIFGVPLTHVLPTEQTTLNFVLLSALVMFCTTMCLCILFIPKIKIRHQVSGKFLNPSLNSQQVPVSSSEKKPVASGSVSDTKDSSDIGGKTLCVTNISSDGCQGNKYGNTEIVKERMHGLMKVEEETKAIEGQQ